jgi:ABC-type multidrug transport system ATPase subunit
MGEAEETCDRVGFIFKGKLVTVGTPTEISRMFAEHTTLELVLGNTTEQSVRGIATLSGIEIISLESAESSGTPAFKLVLHATSDEMVPQAVTYFERLGGKVISLNVRKPNLEDAYIHLSRRQKG